MLIALEAVVPHFFDGCGDCYIFVCLTNIHYFYRGCSAEYISKRTTHEWTRHWLEVYMKNLILSLVSSLCCDVEQQLTLLL